MNEAKQHNQEFEMAEFNDSFLASTFENWQSEFLQLLTAAVLTSFLIRKGSAQSKDGENEIKERLQKIERLLEGASGGKKK